MTQLPPLLFILPRFVFILFTLPPALYLPLTHTHIGHSYSIAFSPVHLLLPRCLSPACTSHALLTFFIFIFSPPRWSIACPAHETRSLPFSLSCSQRTRVFVLAVISHSDMRASRSKQRTCVFTTVTHTVHSPASFSRVWPPSVWLRARCGEPCADWPGHSGPHTHTHTHKTTHTHTHTHTHTQIQWLILWLDERMSLAQAPRSPWSRLPRNDVTISV